jgi:hypothetical protein
MSFSNVSCAGCTKGTEKEYILHTKKAVQIVEMFDLECEGAFTAVLAKMKKPVLHVCKSQLKSQSFAAQPGWVEIPKNAVDELFIDHVNHSMSAG